MGCFEQEKDGAGATRPKAAESKRPEPAPAIDSSKLFDFDKYFEDSFKGMQLVMLRQLKSVRDDVERSIPKLLELSMEQRHKLYVSLHGTKMMLGVSDGFRPTVLGADGKPDKEPDPIREALESIKPYFMVDPAKATASQRKEFLAEAQLEWKSAKAKLDALLERPDVKELLLPSKAVVAPAKPGTVPPKK